MVLKIIAALLSMTALSAGAIEVVNKPYKKPAPQVLTLPIGNFQPAAVSAPVIVDSALIPQSTNEAVVTSPVSKEVAQKHVFRVSAEDKTLREALQRWAKEAGWVHEPEHWQVLRDLPINAADNYEADFRGAVRALLASSRFTDMPVQPCFHSNKVVRVVSEAELCDKNRR